METPVRILIVDDDDVCRELLKGAIDSESVEIALAADGMEALQYLRENPVDILITDLNMPHMDGLELLREAGRIHADILTIIITGYGTLESAIAAIRRGAYDYVQKPFKIEQISVVTRNAVDKIKILRDKARLLKELESAYLRVQTLEREFHELSVPHQELQSQGPYYLASRQTLPLALFEKPRMKGVDTVLGKLERLRQLKKEGTITEKEFIALKRTVLSHLELEEP